jgi:hypothetical protein
MGGAGVHVRSDKYHRPEFRSSVMKTLSKRCRALFILLVLLVIGGCQEDPESSSLGKEYVNSQTRVGLIDTFAVTLSTVIMDTVETSGTGSMLVGSYRDGVFGSVTSESYLQIGVPESFEVGSDDVYDSLRLVLTYSTYAFGDTAQPQRLLVHKLTGEIEYEYDYSITSGASFGYDAAPLGALTYAPAPHSENTMIAIPMSDQLGRDLFSRLADESETVTDNDLFRTVLPGLVIREDPSYAGNIIGFFGGPSTVRLVLYTRKAETHEENPVTFALQDSSKQFNHIVHDFAGTPLAGLVRQRHALPAGDAGGRAFVQGGTGLAIRVEFPSLSEVLTAGRRTLLAAKLTFAPQVGTYTVSTLPTQLYLHQSDDVNTFGSTVTSSALTVDEMYGEGTVYSFDITSYLREEFADSYIDPGAGLLITLPSSSLYTQCMRLVGDAHSRNLKLSLYFLSY